MSSTRNSLSNLKQLDLDEHNEQNIENDEEGMINIQLRLLF
jgi:hypothetical protein